MTNYLAKQKLKHLREKAEALALEFQQLERQIREEKLERTLYPVAGSKDTPSSLDWTINTCQKTAQIIYKAATDNTLGDTNT